MTNHSKQQICELIREMGGAIPEVVRNSPSTAEFAYGQILEGFVPLHRVDDGSPRPAVMPDIVSINPLTGISTT